jgi:hypothetical protein
MTDAEVHTSLLAHVARYFDACDRCDLDEVMAVLEGATVVAGAQEVSDPAVVRAVYEARQPAPTADGRRSTKHHATNLLVDGPDADGRYGASVYYFRLEPSESGPRIATSGRLEQIVVPVGDGWRVLRHSIVTDF